MTATRILAAALALAAGAAFAGTADVRFVDPDRFSDLAANKWEEPDTLKALSAHFQQLAARLPADAVLRVEVLDVDLAGAPVFSSRHGQQVRIMSNRADPPKFHLRWALESQGRVLRQGDDQIADLDYTHHQLASRRSSTPLYYEKRLLDEWFSRKVAPEKQADAG